jgi:hypothetical protein
VSKKIKCDICGEISDVPVNYVSGMGEYVINIDLRIQGFSSTYYDHPVDLCTNCYGEIKNLIIKWLKEKGKI